MATKPSAKSLAHIPAPLRGLAVSIETLNPDPLNARIHSEDNLAEIAQSMAQFGQDQLLVVQRRGRVVRKGNGRLAAAKSLGWKWIAALIVDDSEVDATLRAVADNRASELGQWSEKALKALAEHAAQVSKEAPTATETISRSIARIADERGFNWVPGQVAAARAPLITQAVEENITRVEFKMNETQYSRLLVILGAVMQREGVDSHTDAVLKLFELHAQGAIK